MAKFAPLPESTIVVHNLTFPLAAQGPRLEDGRNGSAVGARMQGLAICGNHVWITTVRSEPGLGDATAVISNAKSFPSRSTAVGQIEGRMLDPAG